IPRPIPYSLMPRWRTFAKVWGLLCAAAALAALFVASILRLVLLPAPQGNSLTGHTAPRRGPGPIWLAFGLGAMYHLAITASLPVKYNQFDPLIYFHKGMSLAENGTFVTDCAYLEIDRLPGYPFFLAACLKTFGYQLKLITLTQGLVFALSL